MARKKKEQKQEDIQVLQVDLGPLAGGTLPAVPAPQASPAPEPEEIAAEAEMEAGTQAEQEVKSIDVVTVETYQQLGFEEVLEGVFALQGVRIEIQRKVWNGQRRPKKGSFDGFRNGLKEAGFIIENPVHANGTDGRLSEADYTDGKRTLHIAYGVADGYGHVVTAS